jgi:hypothetical protein
MNPYYACSSCACYVKRGDPICPFCGTPNRARAVAPSRQLARMSRAQWLAYGSALAALGCTGSAATGPSHAQDATAQNEANAETVDGAVDGTPDTGPSSDAAVAGEVTFAAADGGFVCMGGIYLPSWDGSVCDRATQWCFLNNGGYGPSGCRSLDTTCAPGLFSDAACTSVFDWDAAACDGGPRRCACLTLTGCAGIYPGSCTDADAGGVVVSCGECYGAPPARIERLASAGNIAVS